MGFKRSLLAKRILTIRFPSFKDVGIYYELFVNVLWPDRHASLSTEKHSRLLSSQLKTNKHLVIA